MMKDSLLQERTLRHIDELTKLAEKEYESARKNNSPWEHTVSIHLRELRQSQEIFLRYGKDLTNAYRYFQDLGFIEIITCGATHGYLPLMSAFPEAVRAQLGIAVNQYKEVFGKNPRGIWLPECAYVPGLDAFLKEFGINYFITDTDALWHANPQPAYGRYLDNKYASYTPVITPSGCIAVCRDPETKEAVWSRDSGYPGDSAYLEFHRDLGYDADISYIGDYLAHLDRRPVGLKYHRITGKDVPLDKKEYYHPGWAAAKVNEHAGHFVWARGEQGNYLNGLFWKEKEAYGLGHFSKPLITCAYDAELFGHWWYEGPAFLDMVMRKFHYDQRAIRPVTISEYLDENRILQYAEPGISSWGKDGDFSVWLNGRNAWIYRHLLKAAERMIKLAKTYLHPDERMRRALNQAARELLLAQSSDWAFLIDTVTAREYSEKRTVDHIYRFNKLYEQIVSGNIDEEFLNTIERMDTIFPRIDYRTFAVSSPLRDDSGFCNLTVAGGYEISAGADILGQIEGVIRREVKSGAYSSDRLSRYFREFVASLGYLTFKGIPEIKDFLRGYYLDLNLPIFGEDLLAGSSPAVSRKQEAYARYYFREISKLYLRAMELVSHRKSQAGKGSTDKRTGELGQALVILAGEENLSVWVKKELATAADLVLKGNEPAACAALLAAIRLLCWELTALTKRPGYYPRFRMSFNPFYEVYKVCQGQLVNYNIDTEKKIMMRIPMEKRYALLWDAFRGADHQLDNQVDEVIWINSALKALEGKLYGGQIGELAARLEKALVLEKEIAYFGLKIILAMLKTNEEKEIKRAQDTAEVIRRLLEDRKKSLLDMIAYAQGYRLEYLRDAVDSRNQELEERINDILLNFKNGFKKKALSGIYGFINSPKMKCYLAEPEFTGIKQLLGYAGKLIRDNNEPKAVIQLTEAGENVREAGYLARFVSAFRDSYVRLSLENKYAAVSKEGLFEQLFCSYLKKANLSRGSPDFENRILRAEFRKIWYFQALFVPYRIDHPILPRQRIDNPAFKAITIYLAKIKHQRLNRQEKARLCEELYQRYKDKPGSVDKALLEKACLSLAVSSSPAKDDGELDLIWRAVGSPLFFECLPGLIGSAGAISVFLGLALPLLGKCWSGKFFGEGDRFRGIGLFGYFEKQITALKEKILRNGKDNKGDSCDLQDFIRIANLYFEEARRFSKNFAYPQAFYGLVLDKIKSLYKDKAVEQTVEFRHSMGMRLFSRYEKEKNRLKLGEKKRLADEIFSWLYLTPESSSFLFEDKAWKEELLDIQEKAFNELYALDDSLKAVGSFLNTFFNDIYQGIAKMGGCEVYVYTEDNEADRIIRQAWLDFVNNPPQGLEISRVDDCTWFVVKGQRFGRHTSSPLGRFAFISSEGAIGQAAIWVVISMVFVFLSVMQVFGGTASIVILSNTLAITGLLCLQESVLKKWEEIIRSYPIRGPTLRFACFNRTLNRVILNPVVFKMYTGVFLYLFLLPHEYLHKITHNIIFKYLFAALKGRSPRTRNIMDRADEFIAYTFGVFPPFMLLMSVITLGFIIKKYRKERMLKEEAQDILLKLDSAYDSPDLPKKEAEEFVANKEIKAFRQALGVDTIKYVCSMTGWIWRRIASSEGMKSLSFIPESGPGPRDPSKEKDRKRLLRLCGKEILQPSRT